MGEDQHTGRHRHVYARGAKNQDICLSNLRVFMNLVIFKYDICEYLVEITLYINFLYFLIRCCGCLPMFARYSFPHFVATAASHMDYTYTWIMRSYTWIMHTHASICNILSFRVYLSINSSPIISIQILLDVTATSGF